jgi:hypothetical protein
MLSLSSIIGVLGSELAGYTSYTLQGISHLLMASAAVVSLELHRYAYKHLGAQLRVNIPAGISGAASEKSMTSAKSKFPVLGSVHVLNFP